jgi:ubiquinone/menaquinone biosynthesis C-methylase UbiE
MQWGKAASFPSVYEELCVAGFFLGFADELVQAAKLSAGDRLLDIATGTGIVLRQARLRHPDLGRTTGLDLNPSMLAVAREMSPSDVELVEGSALSMPFEDGSFDVLTCQQGVQFFPDRIQAFSEFHRVLANGGHAVVACWAEVEACPAYAAIVDVVAEQMPDALGAAMNPFALPDAGELRGLFEGAGFGDVEVERVERPMSFATPADFAQSYLGGSALALVLEEKSEEARKALTDATVARLTDLGGEGAFTPPLVTNVAKGRKAAS